MANLRVAIDKVAPPAGAWIETGGVYQLKQPAAGRAPRGRVD